MRNLSSGELTIKFIGDSRTGHVAYVMNEQNQTYLM